MNDFSSSKKQFIYGSTVPLPNSGVWNEDLHPRDEIGQFTYSEGAELSLSPLRSAPPSQEPDQHIPFEDLRIDRQLRVTDANTPSRIKEGSEGYKRARDLMISFEVSDRNHYEKEETYPTVPGNDSGVTIGIGYDLGQVTRREFDADWGGKLTSDQMNRLRPYVGVSRPSRKIAETQLHDIKIPWEVAKDVFAQKTLPQAIKETRIAYPELDNLPPDCQAALVSLVDNRGRSLNDTKNGLTREHMRAIKAALEKGHLEEIPRLFKDMSILWDNGVQDRRIREGETFRKGLSHLK